MSSRIFRADVNVMFEERALAALAANGDESQTRFLFPI
jgi:hypothetical protein